MRELEHARLPDRMLQMLGTNTAMSVSSTSPSSFSPSTSSPTPLAAESMYDSINDLLNSANLTSASLLRQNRDRDRPVQKSPARAALDPSGNDALRHSALQAELGWSHRHSLA